MRQRIKDNIKYCDSDDNEDRSVIEFLSNLNLNVKYKYIEMGSGLCRFPIKLSRMFNHLDIECYEINEKNAQIAVNNGFVTHIGNILQNKINTESYDIIHCSHIIEHFKYPDVITFIDEMLRIVKTNGYIIIRSPLMWGNFFDDIDHIRPYPPAAIINYLNNPQQQVVGHNKVSIVNIWYRTYPKQVKYVSENSPIFHTVLLKNIRNRWVHFINKRLMKMWNKYRWPYASINGYVMILKKEE